MRGSSEGSGRARVYGAGSSHSTRGRDTEPRTACNVSTRWEYALDVTTETSTVDSPTTTPVPAAEALPEDDTGPGIVDATLRRGFALLSGLALVVAFFLPWIEATDLNLRSLTGLQIVLDGDMQASTRAAVFAVPMLGLVLLVAGYVGRRSALFVGLLAGISLTLVGAWQTLSYLAESIGAGLWVVAAASMLALIGGIPWQRVIRGMRGS